VSAIFQDLLNCWLLSQKIGLRVQKISGFGHIRVRKPPQSMSSKVLLNSIL
jgi:hypothetical protein